MNKDVKILVYYIGTAMLSPEDIPDYISKVTSKIIPQTFNGEIIIIPTQTYDTRVECINPKYITDLELIKEHETLMKELNHKLYEQIKIKKNEKT